MRYATLAEWLEEVLPLLLSHKVTKLEAKLDEGDVTAYWAGTVLRIDLKPIE